MNETERGKYVKERHCLLCGARAGAFTMYDWLGRGQMCDHHLRMLGTSTELEDAGLTRTVV